MPLIIKTAGLGGHMGQKTLGYTELRAGARLGTIRRYTRKTQTKGRWGADLWQPGRNPKLMTSLLWPGLKYPSAIHLVFIVVSTFYTVQFSREVGRYIF